jgi:alpha-tubulin suppressor-like RCC1 family protein
MGVSGGVQVASSGDHGCARTSTNEVWCWGKGDFGAIGDGATTDRRTAVRVTGFSAISIWRGGEHSLGVDASNVLHAWGHNNLGQIGDGTTTDANTPSPTPLTNVRQAFGRATTCAVTLTGGVSCWGSNGGGAVGDGTNSMHTSPVTVAF